MLRQWFLPFHCWLVFHASASVPWVRICLSIPLLLNICVDSPLLDIIYKIAINLLIQSFRGYKFLFLLDKYLGLTLLSHRVDVCLILWETGKEFSKMIVTFCTLTANVWEFQLLGVIFNIWYCHYFLATLLDVKWYFFVVLVCIYLVTSEAELLMSFNEQRFSLLCLVLFAQIFACPKVTKLTMLIMYFWKRYTFSFTFRSLIWLVLHFRSLIHPELMFLCGVR